MAIRAHGGHGGTGVVAGGCDDPRAAERGMRVGADVADERSGLDHARENPRRHVQHLQQVGRPQARPRVDELRRRRVGELGGHLAGEPVVHEVGDGAERNGGVDETRRGAAGGVQLIQGVERQELDAGDGINLVGRDAFEHGLHDAVRALVTIVIGVLQEDALLADERVVAAPGIDADAVDGRGGSALHPLLELEPDAQDIPVERSVLADRFVDEPVQLADVEHARAEPAEHGTAALGSEIERQKMSACRHRGFYGAPQDTLSIDAHKTSFGGGRPVSQTGTGGPSGRQASRASLPGIITPVGAVDRRKWPGGRRLGRRPVPGPYFDPQNIMRRRPARAAQSGQTRSRAGPRAQGSGLKQDLRVRGPSSLPEP